MLRFTGNLYFKAPNNPVSQVQLFALILYRMKPVVQEDTHPSSLSGVSASGPWVSTATRHLSPTWQAAIRLSQSLCFEWVESYGINVFMGQRRSYISHFFLFKQIPPVLCQECLPHHRSQTSFRPIYILLSVRSSVSGWLAEVDLFARGLPAQRTTDWAP